MIKVIEPFFDLQDDCYEYKRGDTYPRNDYEVTDARMQELASEKNKLGKALIMVEKPKMEAKPRKKKTIEE
jgi:hypothetical protein